MKKVKTKRRFKFRILGYLFLMFAGYQISYNIIMEIKLARNNEDFIKCLLADSNYHMLYEKKASNLLSKLFAYAFDINSPVTILENAFHFSSNEELTTYVSVSEEEKQEPLVYIYNSHQSEEYEGDSLEGYNISPGVMMASYIFENKLEEQGVSTIVMEDNLIDYMNLNNMKHSLSYQASRQFITPVISENTSLKLIIDLHRDSISHDKATATINGKQCAKIAFVIGTDYDTYETNLNYAKILNEKIKEKYPDLTRGIITKGGSGSNGVYNQDLNGNMILIELGTNVSTIDEVLNTIELLTPIIKEFVNE